MVDVCTVKVATAFWQDSKGLHSKKSLIFLKRKCQGFNILKEDSDNMGVEEVLPRVVNLGDSADGVYTVVTCDESRDWETGLIDDYNYRLVPVPDHLGGAS